MDIRSSNSRQISFYITMLPTEYSATFCESHINRVLEISWSHPSHEVREIASKLLPIMLRWMNTQMRKTHLRCPETLPPTDLPDPMLFDLELQQEDSECGAPNSFLHGHSVEKLWTKYFDESLSSHSESD